MDRIVYVHGAIGRSMYHLDDETQQAVAFISKQNIRVLNREKSEIVDKSNPPALVGPN